MDLLVGDIGGTHCRFGRVGSGSFLPDAVAIENDDDHESFADAVAAYLDRSGRTPVSAAFAVAGPVHGRRARLTNRGWDVDADALARRFGFGRVELMNDFVAQASALPYLDADETRPIGRAEPVADAPKAALGPGTGLGVSAILPVDDGWLPVASEGGHVELAAVTAREAAVFDAIRRASGRVSAETALSGAGLPRLFDAIAAADGGAPPASLSPAEVTKRAEAGDPAAVEAVALFLGVLARFAGDVALTFGARGGVYLCGGVLPKMLGLLDDRAFRAAFEAKAPHEAIMRDTATLVVTSPIAGLIGCAGAMSRLAGATGR